MSSAPEVDVADLRLSLEDGAHEIREVRVDAHDLLELVEDHDHPALAFLCEPAEQLEERFDRLVDVRFPPGRPEVERDRRVLGIELHGRPDPQAPEEI